MALAFVLLFLHEEICHSTASSDDGIYRVASYSYLECADLRSLTQEDSLLSPVYGSSEAQWTLNSFIHTQMHRFSP